MRFVFAVFIFLLSSTSCAPKKVENPAANAKTYSAEEYALESNAILNADKAQKIGISVEKEIGEDQSILFKINFPKKMKSLDQVKACRQAIFEELENIEIFLKKYEGSFRLRYQDGDLKLKKLTSEVLDSIQVLKLKWTEALKQLEVFEAQAEAQENELKTKL